MNKKAFAELTASIKEAGEIKRGKAKPSRRIEIKPPNVRSIRRRFSASQSGFAKMLGVSVDTIQNWEQGRCYPTDPARVLLVVPEHNPDLLISTLNPDVDYAGREMAFAPA